jgi:hypothetical protein
MGEALRALPEITPNRDAWPAVRRALPRKVDFRHPGWWGAALAASVAGALFLAPQFRSPVPAPQVVAAQPLPGLVARSQALEADWQRLTPTRVVSLREAARSAALQDRIAMLDQMLADGWSRQRNAGLEQELWRQRVASMQQLVDLRMAPSGWSRTALKEPASSQRR